MNNLDGFEWDCITISSQIPGASSRFSIAGDIPPSVTLVGLNPFMTEYGPPVMYVYNGTSGTPNLVTTITASSVNSAGSTATFPLPSSLTLSAYAFVTANKTPDGIVPNSFNLYSIASSQTIAGRPFGVSVGAQTDAYERCTPSVIGETTQEVTPDASITPKCTISSSYLTFPVISLYSSNQVLINGTAVAVGKNPTAIETYPSVMVRTSNTDDAGITTTNTYTGNTRAVVANSGSNTISVLDIVNDEVLFNVTVGTQPVALAVSSDGSTAYVANYKDSTITQVNLNTGAATKTVAVGGKPTVDRHFCRYRRKCVRG
jgi:YVTN family beta-propeller protein